PGGRLGDGVGGRGSAVDPAGGGQHIEEGSSAVVLEHGSEGLCDAQYPEDIRIELLAGGGTGLRLEQTAQSCNPCIVDDKADVTADSRGRGHVLIRGNVEFNGHDARSSDRGWGASAGINFACTARQCGFGEGESDA